MTDDPTADDPSAETQDASRVHEPDAWRVHTHDGWRVELPAGVTGEPVRNVTNPDITSVAIYRGWVGDDAMFVGVTVRPRQFTSLRAETRTLSRWFHDAPLDGELVDVAGVRGGARRVDGLMDLEEGYGEAPDWTERITYVVAARGRHEVVILTIRRHPRAPLDDVADRIVASFSIGMTDPSRPG